MDRPTPPHRRWLPVLVLLALMVMGGSIARADGGDLQPPPPTNGAATPPTPLYDRYPASAYTLDSAAYFADAAWKGTHIATNALLGLKAWGVQLSIRFTEYALDGTLWNPLVRFSESSLKALHKSLWQADGAPWVAGALSLAGLASLVTWSAGRSTRAFKLLGSTVLILMASYATLALVPGSTANLQELARAASTQTFGTVAAATGSQNSAGLIEAGGTALFRNLVYEPWVAFEFTDHNAAVRYGSADLPGQQLLSMAPQQRMQLYRSLNNDAARSVSFAPWSEDGTVPRLVMAAWTFVAAALAAGPVLLLAGSMLVQQVLLLVLVALLPVWLLVALWWPGGGLRVLRRVLTLGLGALVLQAVLAVTLALGLSLTHAAGVMLAPLGWSTLALLLAVIGVACYRYRYAWLEVGAHSGSRIMNLVSGRTAVHRTGRLPAQGETPTQASDTEAPFPTFATMRGRAMDAPAPEPTPEPASQSHSRITRPSRETVTPTTTSERFQDAHGQQPQATATRVILRSTAPPETTGITAPSAGENNASPPSSRPRLIRNPNGDEMQSIPRERPRPL